MIITVFWLYRGLRVGMYSALNMFLVFFMSLVVTLNYFDLWMPVVAKITPQSSPTIRQTVSLIFTYFLTFGVFLYFCLWLSTERIQVHKTADRVLGGLLGVATGIACCAALLFMWFSLPFAERVLPTDESTMFFPCHKLTFRGITVVRKAIPGKREFDGERFLRDLRYGLPQIQEIGDGYYITSVPAGLSVFFELGGQWQTYDGTGKGIRAFYERLKKRMAVDPDSIPPSEKRKPFGRKGRTPLFIPGSSGGAATVAVMWDKLPDIIQQRTDEADKRFVPDGEVAVAETHISDHELFMKIYQVEKTGNVGALVALFEPNRERVSKGELDLREFMPLRVCYPLDENRTRKIQTDLMKNGVAADRSAKLIDQLRMCGKAVFRGLGDEPMAIEMTGIGKWRIFSLPTPINLEKPESDEKKPTPRPAAR